MKTTFVSIQGSYSQLQISLFQGSSCLQTIIKDDVKASSHLVPYLDELLANHSLSLKDLDFIAVDYGPGAFTSLRVIIATVNGISFASQKPLIAVDGLEALWQQTRDEQNISDDALLVCLLNAYNNDVYYLAQSGAGGIKSCEKIDVVLEKLAERSEQELLFVGNAVEMHADLIQEKLGDKKIQFIQNPPVASSEQIGSMALHNWESEKNTMLRIVPNYMKTQLFAIRKTGKN